MNKLLVSILAAAAMAGAAYAQAPSRLDANTAYENVSIDIDRMQARLERMPEAMTIRRQTVEHPFGTIKAWMRSTHFLMKTLEKVKTEMSLHVLAYNLKRMIKILGVGPLLKALEA